MWTTLAGMVAEDWAREIRSDEGKRKGCREGTFLVSDCRGPEGLCGQTHNGNALKASHQGAIG
jgi:hypothetical protein